MVTLSSSQVTVFTTKINLEPYGKGKKDDHDTLHRVLEVDVKETWMRQLETLVQDRNARLTHVDGLWLRKCDGTRTDVQLIIMLAISLSYLILN